MSTDLVGLSIIMFALAIYEEYKSHHWWALTCWAAGSVTLTTALYLMSL